MARDPYRHRARSYENLHGEIFNVPEQERLEGALRAALALITDERSVKALDFGCGSGNVTKTLLMLGVPEVVAADVSPAFLKLIREKLSIETLLLCARDSASSVPTGRFDLIAMYSVLHHIPDYLGAVTALVRRLTVGGILFIDHEHNGEHWHPTPELAAFFAEVDASLAQAGGWWSPDYRRWQHLLRAAVSPRRHQIRLRRKLDPRYSPEGDIHVHCDDHIDFAAVTRAGEHGGGVVLQRYDYLHFKAHYPRAVWERYRQQCTNMGTIVIQRLA